MPRSPRQWPVVEVGQRREDPDLRVALRIVTVVEMGAPPVNGGADASVWVERGGRRSRIRVRRLERWRVIDEARGLLPSVPR